MSSAKPEGEKKEIPEWQRRVAQATNAAGVAAGPAAILMAVQQAQRKQGGLPRKGVERLAAAKPQSSKVQRVARVMRNPKVVAAGGATAVGLQAANMFGDATAVRALTQQKKNEEGSVKKMTSQSVSQGVYGHGESGVGTNLEMVEKADRLKCPKCDCDCTEKGICPECGMDCRKVAKAGKKPKCPHCEIPCDANNKCPMCGKDCSAIAKAYRRFDSEADRQRRLGLYAGLGGGAAIVAGDRARRGFQRVDDVPKGGKRSLKTLRGMRLKSGGLRGTLISAGVAGAAGALGAGAYRRGVSRRNQPWD